MSKERYKTKKVSQAYKIWNYMRRNKVFRGAEPIMIIDGLNRSLLLQFLQALEKVGYLKKEKNAYRMEDQEYTLAENTGAKAPRVNMKMREVYDPNLNITIKWEEKE